MKRSLIVLSIIFIIYFSSGFFSASAEVLDTSTSQTPINARIVPLVWFSDLPINDGDNLKIYAAVQNNSGIDFNGLATFYVDNKEISDIEFNSHSGNLQEVSTSWLSGPGVHDFQVKIKAATPTSKTLLAYETDKSSVEVKRKSVEVVKKDTIVTNIIDEVSSIDEALAPFVDKIENLRRPILDTKRGSVGGVGQSANAIGSISSDNIQSDTSSSRSLPSKSNKGVDIAFNSMVNVLAFLTKHWALTSSTLLLLLWKILH